MTRLTVAICSNRPESVLLHLERLADAVAPGDCVVVIVDDRCGLECQRLRDAAKRIGATVLCNEANRGLSFTRNLVLDTCTTSYVLFVDDDVVLNRSAVEAIRAALRIEYGVVGVRLRLPSTLPLPWFISEGQLHYLGAHASAARGIWGACMGLNVDLVRACGVRFRPELGRRGRDLQCGDDTTFLAELRQCGVEECLLHGESVVHDVDRSRCKLRYMLRRTYWQGRSEVRRHAPWRGLRKEWKRFRAGCATSALAWPLLLLYSGALVGGMVHELLLSLVSQERRR